MVEAVLRYTEEEKRIIIEQRKIRNSNYARRETWIKKINKAIYCLVRMKVSRIERLIRQNVIDEGYTDLEADYIIKIKHYAQRPISFKKRRRSRLKNILKTG